MHNVGAADQHERDFRAVQADVRHVRHRGELRRGLCGRACFAAPRVRRDKRTMATQRVGCFHLKHAVPAGVHGIVKLFGVARVRVADLEVGPRPTDTSTRGILSVQKGAGCPGGPRFSRCKSWHATPASVVWWLKWCVRTFPLCGTNRLPQPKQVCLFVFWRLPETRHRRWAHAHKGQEVACCTMSTGEV